MLTFDEFLAKYNGQINVGNTSENKGQCVGLSSAWIDNLAGPHVWGDAKDMYDNADSNFFEKIINTPEAIPVQGDIIVWNGKFNRGPGHTAIATGSGDTTKFEVFEQNNPIGSNCHLRTYSSYNYVTGWFRPRNKVIDETLPVKKSDFETLVMKSSEFDKFVAAGYLHVEDVLKALSERENTIQQQTKDIHTCEKQVGELLDNLQKVNEDDKSTSEQLLDAQKALQPYKDTISKINRELGLLDDATDSFIIESIKELKSMKVKVKVVEKRCFLDYLKEEILKVVRRK